MWTITRESLMKMLFQLSIKYRQKRKKKQYLTTKKFKLITHENSHRRLIESNEALAETKDFLSYITGIPL